MILQLQMLPNLDKTSFHDLRLYEFISTLDIARKGFITDYKEVLTFVQNELFESLERSNMELRLLNDVNRQFQKLMAEVKPQFMAMEDVSKGYASRFDLTFATYQTEMYDLRDKIDQFKNIAMIVGDEDLNVIIQAVRVQVDRLIQLGITITNQSSYSVERFKSGKMGADVFEVIHQINWNVVKLKDDFQTYEDRIVELMSI